MPRILEVVPDLTDKIWPDMRTMLKVWSDVSNVLNFVKVLKLEAYKYVEAAKGRA